jgi:hypothetical protein
MNATDVSGLLGTFGTSGLPANASTTHDELTTVFQLNSVLAGGGGSNLANGVSLTGMVGDLTPIAHFRPSSPGSTTGTFINDITPGTGPLILQQNDLLFFGELGRNPLSNTVNPPSSNYPAQTGSGGYVIVSDTTGTGFGFNATGQGRNESMQNLSLQTGGQSVTGGTDSNPDNFTNGTGSAIANGNIVVAARFEDLTALGNSGSFAAPSGFNYTNASLISLMNTVKTNTGQDTLFLEEGNVGNGSGPFGTEATNAVGTGLLDVVGGLSAGSFTEVGFNNTNTVGSVPFGFPAKIALTLQSQFNFSATNYTTFQAGSNDPLNYVGFENAAIQISPTTASNPVGVSHTFTITGYQNTGTGDVPVPDGTEAIVTLTASNGAGIDVINPIPFSTTPASSPFSTATYHVTFNFNSTATWPTITISSPTAGTITAHATYVNTNFTTPGIIVNNITLIRSTGDGITDGTTNGTDSPDAVKTYTNLSSNGLTPGFWKNNWEKFSGSAWAFTYNPVTMKAFTGNDQLGSAGIFSASLLTAIGIDPTTTLDQALQFGGGNTITAAAQILLRQAVAALLNATYGTNPANSSQVTTMGYALTYSDIINKVNTALGTQDRTAILTLEAQLDADNNAGNFGIAQKSGKPGT